MKGECNSKRFCAFLVVYKYTKYYTMVYLVEPLASPSIEADLPTHIVRCA
jgi:hypothetical protein